MTTSSDTVTSGTTVTSAATASFDINKVDTKDLAEDVAKAVKGFQGDYTKKMQSLSDEKKKFEEKQKTDGDWNAWFTENKVKIDRFNAHEAKAEEEDASVTKNVTDDDDDGTGAINAIKQLEQNTNKQNKEMNEAYSEGFQMLVKLQALAANAEKEGKPVPDPERVIKYAKENGLIDVKKAYEGAYSDEILEAKINKAVTDARATWDAKNQTDVLNQNMPQRREVRKVLAKDRGKK